MKILVFALVLIFAFLQYELWFSKNGVREYFALKEEIRLQKEQNTAAKAQNQQLINEITNLRQGHEAIEEHARHDLCMIKPGETFYQVVAPKAH